jgi:hypothetical protein
MVQNVISEGMVSALPVVVLVLSDGNDPVFGWAEWPGCGVVLMANDLVCVTTDRFRDGVDFGAHRASPLFRVRNGTLQARRYEFSRA